MTRVTPSLRKGTYVSCVVVRSDRPLAFVVENSPEIRELEAVVAVHCGCAVTTGDGDHLLALLHSETPDVLLLGSPVYLASGETVLDVLRREDPSIARRTIVLTTHLEDAALLTRAAAANVYAVVGKPFDILTLSATIRDCVRGAGAEDPVRWIGIPAPVLRSISAAAAGPPRVLSQRQA